MRYFIQIAAAAWNQQTDLLERPMRHRSRPNERKTFGFHSASLIIIKIKASFLQFQDPLPCNLYGSKGCSLLMDKTPTHALFTQHYISLEC